MKYRFLKKNMNLYVIYLECVFFCMILLLLIKKKDERSIDTQTDLLNPEEIEVKMINDILLINIFFFKF